MAEFQFLKWPPSAVLKMKICFDYTKKNRSNFVCSLHIVSERLCWKLRAFGSPQGIEVPGSMSCDRLYNFYEGLFTSSSIFVELLYKYGLRSLTGDWQVENFELSDWVVRPYLLWFAVVWTLTGLWIVCKTIVSWFHCNWRAKFLIWFALRAVIAWREVASH